MSDRVRVSQAVFVRGVTCEVSFVASFDDFQRLVLGSEPDATGRIAQALPELMGAALHPALVAARAEFERSLLASWDRILLDDIGLVSRI